MITVYTDGVIVHQRLNYIYMYKFYYVPVLLLAFVLGACSNDESIETESFSDEIQVTFKVSTLTVEHEDMDNPPASRRATRAASSGSDIGDVIHSVVFNIYDANSKYVTTLESGFDPANESAPEGFGTFKARLKPGTYFLYVLAEGKGTGQAYFFNSKTFMETGSGKNNGRICNTGNIETYYYGGKITVSKNDNEIGVSVKRMSALLKVQINDEKPENVGKVTYSFKDYRDWYNIYAGNLTYNEETVTATPEFTENQLDLYEYYFPMVKDDGEYKTIKITIYDTNNNILIDRDVNFAIYPNKRTIISGDLFSILNEKDLTITVDDIWAGDVNVEL